MEARRNGLQMALDFLSVVASDLNITIDSLPGRIDYASLARLARERRYAVNAEDIEQAFRIFMRARLASWTVVRRG